LMPGMPGMPGMVRKMPGMPAMDSDGLESLSGRLLNKNDNLVPSPALPLSQGRSQAPVIKPSVGNARLLPQGTGGFLTGKPSALLQNSTARPLTASGPNVGAAEPLIQGLLEDLNLLVVFLKSKNLRKIGSRLPCLLWKNL